MSEEKQRPCCQSAQQNPESNANTQDNQNRRNFLLKLGVGLNVVAGALVSVPIVGYLFSSFAEKKNLEWIDLGKVDKFPQNTTRLASFKNPHSRTWDGETADIPCWVRRIENNDFQVFAINCAHLGCPVRWFEESKLFMCPCHGGVYYQDGSRASGPPPRGLFAYETKIKNGSLFIKGGMLPTLSNPGTAESTDTPA
ncbi:MAG: ubiquinol-cytochrome c reductase iron-sulfur subunit [Chthoniobacterales bacterium]